MSNEPTFTRKKSRLETCWQQTSTLLAYLTYLDFDEQGRAVRKRFDCFSLRLLQELNILGRLNEEGKIWASLETLADRCNMSRSVVADRLKDLTRPIEQLNGRSFLTTEAIRKKTFSAETQKLTNQTTKHIHHIEDLSEELMRFGETFRDSDDWNRIPLTGLVDNSVDNSEVRPPEKRAPLSASAKKTHSPGGTSAKKTLKQIQVKQTHLKDEADTTVRPPPPVEDSDSVPPPRAVPGSAPPLKSGSAVSVAASSLKGNSVSVLEPLGEHRDTEELVRHEIERQLRQWGWKLPQVRMAFSEYQLDCILNAIDYTKLRVAQGKANNPGAYMHRALKGNWGSDMVSLLNKKSRRN